MHYFGLPVGSPLVSLIISNTGCLLQNMLLNPVLVGSVLNFWYALYFAVKVKVRSGRPVW